MPAPSVMSNLKLPVKANDTVRDERAGGHAGGPPVDSSKLSTFRGVVVPTLEFMWSVILFARFGYIVGESGVVCTILMTLGCAALVTVTLTSISAIATNEIPTGGIYSILTRSLGSGIGSAISVLYFFGITVFIGLEIVGSVQAVLVSTKFSLSGSAMVDQNALSVLSLLVVFGIAMAGPRVVHGIELLFLGILMLSFASIFAGFFAAPRGYDFNGHITGLSLKTLIENLHPEGGADLIQSLSFILPCFVGIFSGTNNAVHLKNPSESIPKGGFLSVGTSLFIRLEEMDGPFILSAIAYPTPGLASVGVFLVGIGSALQFMVISTKLLHSLAAISTGDNDPLPNLLRRVGANKLSSGDHQPRTGIIITTILALPFVLLPNLEVLGTLVTMCCLLCYGTTNFACFLL
ncbi:hypothetical protein BJ742DRAFT_773104 [Cladochytrium replicatum]|nr:hypothetical protein BJ742DRAFT_773104 [Cladochytrium replicatum]